MKVFLSWSGENSRAVAAVLNEWLASLFPEVTFWISTDIHPGKRWGNELDAQLQSTRFGILCLVPSNVTAPWLLFEAGALSKSVEASRVVPYCVGFEPEDVVGPLSKFQGVAANEVGTRKLVESINLSFESKRSESTLARTFDKKWPILQRKLAKISTTPSILDARLLDFVDCAERPIYICDNKLIVRYCNKNFLSFIGSRHEDIIGKHVRMLVHLFAKLVPPHRREEFLRSQEEVIKEAERAPYACISEVVDLSQIPFGLNRRMYRVWIQADFIYAGDRKQSIGCVVIYHPVEVTIDPLGRLTLPELKV
jgi:PAS domain-containing protein